MSDIGEEEYQNGGGNPQDGLSEEDKEKIRSALDNLDKIISLLDEIPSDPRAMDALSIAASLFEQQLDMDIPFHTCHHHGGEGEDEEEDEEYHDTYDPEEVESDDNLEGYIGIIQDGPEKTVEDNTKRESLSSPFLFLNNSDPSIPSAKDLQDWLSNGAPNENAGT